MLYRTYRTNPLTLLTVCHPPTQQLLRLIFEVFIRKFKLVTKHKKAVWLRKAINAVRLALLALEAFLSEMNSK